LINISNKKEKEKYFDEQIKECGAYFNVKYPSGEKEFIWVKKFENWMNDGSNWYLESPNQLMKYDIKDISLESYYDEEEKETLIPFEHCYIDGDTAYEIISWQTSPFLPEEFEIEFFTDDEDDAVRYMIGLENNNS
jgi:hypothetical protein